MGERNNADQIQVKNGQITFDDWTTTSDFLARQIVDDLCRAGLSAIRFQHIVERTLLNWPAKGRTWGK
jgi:hypothetical protein